MAEYWHALTPGIVSALVKLAAAVHVYGRNQIHIHDEMKGGNVPPRIRLTDHEWNNFTRLRFHALAAKCGEDGKRKSGYWLLTRRGGQFLRGEIAVPLKVRTFRNKVVGHSDAVVRVGDFRGKMKWFETDFETEARRIACDPILCPPVERRAAAVSLF